MAEATTAGRAIAVNGVAGKKQALYHAAIALVTLFLPLAGKTHGWTAVEQVQIAIGFLGILLTWVIPNFTFPGGGYVKAGATFLVAAGTALYPYLTDGGWSALSGATGAIVLAHVLAGVLGIVDPNQTTTLPATQADDGAHAVTSLPATGETTAAPAVRDPAVDGGYTFGG